MEHKVAIAEMDDSAVLASIQAAWFAPLGSYGPHRAPVFYGLLLGTFGKGLCRARLRPSALDPMKRHIHATVCLLFPRPFLAPIGKKIPTREGIGISHREMKGNA